MRRIVLLHVAQPDAVLSYVVLGMHLHFSVPRHYITSSPSVQHRLGASRTLQGASDLRRVHPVSR